MNEQELDPNQFLAEAAEVELPELPVVEPLEKVADNSDPLFHVIGEPDEWGRREVRAESTSGELVFADTINPSNAKQRKNFTEAVSKKLGESSRMPDLEKLQKYWCADGGYKPPDKTEIWSDAILKAAEASKPEPSVATRKPRNKRKPKATKASSAMLDQRHLTDLGNAELFVEQHSALVRYCHEWKCWLIWNGKYWERDHNGAVERLAKLTVRSRWTEVEKVGDSDDKLATANWARQSEKAERIRAMLKLAESEAEVVIRAEQLDQQPHLLNVANGVIDLRTGALIPHSREQYLTKHCPVDYLPASQAECPLWDAVLWRIFAENRELIGFVQRLFGYALWGAVREHILPIMFGPGANGKSLMLEAIMAVLGDDYAMKAPNGFLMAKRNSEHPTSLADLHGKRLVAAAETEDGGRLAESLAKELTGGDTLRVRRLYENFWQLKPSHLFVLVTNHRPQIRGTDNGIWRRVRLVPFEVVIPPSEQDPRLPEKLREEREGILRWLVSGCLEWQQKGLQEPPIVMAATTQYRTEQDTLAAFLTDCCEVSNDFRGQATALYASYCAWCKESGEYTQSKRKFGEMLTERGFQKIKDSNIFYRGLRLRDEREDGRIFT